MGIELVAHILYLLSLSILTVCIFMLLLALLRIVYEICRDVIKLILGR